MSTDYTNEAQQRLMKLWTLLSGSEINGLAPGEIAKLQGCSASIVTRDLANLQQGGFAERVPETGQWRLSPQIVQIAIRFQVALGNAEQRLDQTRQRFTRI